MGGPSVASSQIYSISVLAPAADRLRGAVRQAKGGVLGAAELYRVARAPIYAMHLRDSTLVDDPHWQETLLHLSSTRPRAAGIRLLGDSMSLSELPHASKPNAREIVR